MLHNQSVNVHQFTSTKAATAFAFNWLKPKFCRAHLALDVYVSRFAPVIRIKEEAVAALTQNRWHPSSLANVLACRQALTNSRHRRFENQASATNRLSRRLVTPELQRKWKSRDYWLNS